MRFPEFPSSETDAAFRMPLADHVRSHHIKFLANGEPVRSGFGGGGAGGELLVMAYEPGQPGHERVVSMPNTQENIEAVVFHFMAEHGSGDVSETDAALPEPLQGHIHTQKS